MLYVGWFFAIAWAIAIIGILGELLFEFATDGTLNFLVWIGVIVPLGVLIAGFPIYALIDYQKEARSPILATLRSSEWECTATATHTTYMTTMVGKTPILTPVQTQTCTQYNTKGNA